MFSSVSCFKIGFLIIPFEEFRVVCSVTSTGTPKKRSSFFRFSVWDFLDVSTNKVWFFNFLQFQFGILSVFQSQKVTGKLSVSLDVLMIRYLAKFSFEVKIAEAESSSSSESGLSRLCVEDAIVKCVCLNSYALHPPWSPTIGRLLETDLQFPAPKLHNYHTRRA